MIIKNINEFCMKMIVLILMATFIFAAFSNVIAKHTPLSSIDGNNPQYYTNQCLNFIKNHNSESNIELVFSKQKITEETNIKYTKVKADIQRDGISHESVIVTMNHENENIEFGDEQIKRDYREYYNKLPRFYQHLTKGLRMKIIDDYGYLPATSEIVASDSEFDNDYSVSYSLYPDLKNEKQESHQKSDNTLSESMNLKSLIELSWKCSGQIDLNYQISIKYFIDESIPAIGGDIAIANGYDGSGAILGIIDAGVKASQSDGIDDIHPAIRPPGDFSRGLIDFEDFIGAGTSSTHGTMVAGIVGSNGNGESPSSTNYIGLAPEMKLVSAAVDDNVEPEQVYKTFKSAITWLTSGSTSTISGLPRNPVDGIQCSAAIDPYPTATLPDPLLPDPNGDYKLALLFDEISHNMEIPIVVAAGNYGQGVAPQFGIGVIGIPADSYNVITVGAADAALTNVWPDSSYLGYTGNIPEDRRVIDVIAPGEAITSSNINWKGTSSSDWFTGSGTSFAAPHVSAVATIISKRLKLEHTLYGEDLITKAIIINSASKLAGWSNDNTHPIDEKQGGGLLNPLKAYETYEDNAQWDIHRHSVPNEMYYYHFQISDSNPFSATGVWRRKVTDHSLETSSQPYLNDFDMRLYKVDHTGKTNTLISSSLSEQNLEHIYKSSLPPGYYAIEINPVNLSEGEEAVGMAFSHPFFKESNSLFLDLTPPTTTHSLSGTLGNSPWYVSDVTVTLTATDNTDPSTAITTYYIIDGGNTQTYSAPFIISEDGSRTLEYWSKDSSNNVELPHNSVSIYIDATPPSTPTTCLSPTSDIQTSGTTASVTFKWSSATDTTSGPGGYRLWVSNDPNFGSLAVNELVGTNEYPTTLARDTWYWKVYAIDNAGNIGGWSTRWDFSIYTPQTTTASVSGFVYTSDGSPISGATVTASGATIVSLPPQDSIKSGSGSSSLTSNPDPSDPYSTTTTTANNGSYTLSGLSVGVDYDITASADGYNSQTKTVTIGTKGTSCDFYLSSSTSSGGGGGGGGTCFVRGTNISTPTGDVSIEDLSVGDHILSFNEETKEIETNKVTGTSAHPPSEYLLINNRLGVTGEHMIYVNGGQIPASAIQIGDILTGLDGDIVVTSIKEITEPLDVYNIEVENNHNYYADGILVHNKAPIFPPGSGWVLCPFVYTWDGTDYVEDNNILPLSTIDRDELDVTDYYLLETEAVPKDGNYSFMLVENQRLQTQLDKLQLAVIDYPDEYEVGVTAEGEWITYSSDMLPPISAMDSDGFDIPWVLAEKDNIYREGEEGYFIDLKFGDLGDVSETKLIVTRKGTVPSPAEPLDNVIPWWRYNKHPIEVQIINDSGDWTTVGIMPTRVKWATSVVNISGVADYIQNNGTIRLLVTGGVRQIDFVGLDVSTTRQVSVNLYSPMYASHQNDEVNSVSSVMDKDGHYMVLRPYTEIEVNFPYQAPIQGQGRRALALISQGHYYPLPDLDIEQSVNIAASVQEGSSGTVSLWLDEVGADGLTRAIVGQTIDLGVDPGGTFRLSFVQNTRNSYKLRTKFEGCNETITISATINSFRDAQTIEISYAPGDDDATSLPLDDILWNVTGVIFDKRSWKFQALKGSLLQFDLNEYYGYDSTNWSNYTWDFGDGLRTQDIRPTHVYESYGTYVLNLVVNDDSTGAWLIFDPLTIDVITSPPFADIEAYQEVNITLRISGRKGNTVTMVIFEDGYEIHNVSIIRERGRPQKETITLDKYEGRSYEIKMYYDAQRKGCNPVKLMFESGDNKVRAFVTFGHIDGFTFYEIFCYYDDVRFKDHDMQRGSSISTDTYSLDGLLKYVTKGNPQFYFDASGSYDIDGDIASYEWDFGDGSTGSGIVVEHTFEDSGTYTVTLVVTDDDGAVREAEYVLLITV